MTSFLKKNLPNNCTIGLITSRGGHLFQIMQLQPWWRHYRRFWVTFPGADTKSLLENERVYFGHYPESRNIINAIKNLKFKS